MDKCLICHQPTTGSVGAAGIKWARICQPCKDKEDKALWDQVKITNQTLGLITKEENK